MNIDQVIREIMQGVGNATGSLSGNLQNQGALSQLQSPILYGGMQKGQANLGGEISRTVGGVDNALAQLIANLNGANLSGLNGLSYGGMYKGQANTGSLALLQKEIARQQKAAQQAQAKAAKLAAQAAAKMAKQRAVPQMPYDDAADTRLTPSMGGDRE